MTRTKTVGTLMIAAALAVGGCNGDEGGDVPEPGAEPAVPGQGMGQEDMALMMELQQIQQQLQPIQEQALQDEELSARLTSLQADIEAAMRDEDAQAMDRMEQLQSDVAAAEAAGDSVEVQRLIMESQMLQQNVRDVQGAVMERPEIRERVEAFEEASRERMIEIDPEAESLLERMDEIVAELSGPAAGN